MLGKLTEVGYQRDEALAQSDNFSGRFTGLVLELEEQDKLITDLQNQEIDCACRFSFVFFAWQ